MKKENLPGIENAAIAVAKGVVGTIPLVGAMAGELLGLIAAAPLENRREKWMEEVGKRLQALEEKGELDLSALSSNDQFIDTVAQAATLVLKNSEEEKLKAFQNAIINTAIGESPNKARTQLYLQWIDWFTVWHLRILRLFENPRLWYTSHGITINGYMMSSSLFTTIKTAFPELSDEQELVTIIWNELQNAGFHNSSGIMTMMTGDGAMEPRLTKEGKSFIDFILEHK